MEKQKITAERVRELFNYSSDTGDMVRAFGIRGMAKGESVGHTNYQGYVCVRADGKIYRRSRLAWLYVYGTHPSIEIDHINRNRSDDRICNLREATRQQNRWNSVHKKMRSNTGYQCIYWKPKDKRYEVKVCNKYIGRFITIEQAIKAFKSATKERGEFLPLEA